jgi:glycosyltransferase involved in cell wall biosynthesis
MGRLPRLTFVGHPFASIGVGEQLRSHVRAAAALQLEPAAYDVFRFGVRQDPDFIQFGLQHETPRLLDGIRVFHVNGDEIEPVRAALAERNEAFDGGYNVIVPAWELPRYPDRWVPGLKLFDEIWAASRFIESSLGEAGLPSHFIGASVESKERPLLSRRYFGIRESAFVFLHFFDTTSYASRKNPMAVVEMFRRLRERHPFADIQLVLKMKTAEGAAEHWHARLAALLPESVLFDKVLSSHETQSLIANCDCFVSLHRAEGLGRGLGEAMALGRIALGTRWSGNVDFMSDADSLLVDYQMVPVGPDEYPAWEGQSWAEPDIEHAVALTDGIWKDTARVERLRSAARTNVLARSGEKAVGVRMLERVRAIAPKLVPAVAA